MAARLTGISYEILLQRAWAEEGLATAPRTAIPARPARSPAQPEAGAQPARADRPGFFQRITRITRKRDAALIGCLAVLAIGTLGLIGLLLVQILGNDEANGDNGISGIASTATPASQSTFTPEPATGTTSRSPVAGVSGASGTPAGNPTPQPLVLDAGQMATFAGGYTARILAYDDDVAEQVPEDAPAPGFHFAAVQVEVCGGLDGGTSSPDDWLVEMPGGTRHERAGLPIESALAARELAANGCAAGWIAFEIPLDGTPVYIFHANPAYEPIRFAWPG